MNFKGVRNNNLCHRSREIFFYARMYDTLPFFGYHDFKSDSPRFDFTTLNFVSFDYTDCLVDNNAKPCVYAPHIDDVAGRLHTARMCGACLQMLKSPILPAPASIIGGCTGCFLVCGIAPKYLGA